MTFEFPIRADASLLVGVALLIAACSRPGSTAGSSALKPIDQAALQSLVDTTIWVRARTAGLKGMMGAWTPPARIIVV